VCGSDRSATREAYLKTRDDRAGIDVGTRHHEEVTGAPSVENDRWRGGYGTRRGGDCRVEGNRGY
jgi:hypothetical protein